MKLHHFAVACVVLGLLSGCNGGSTVTPTFMMNGIASFGAPLVGVVVSATDPNGKVFQSTVTDANGNYAMTLAGYGPYVLTAPFNDADGSPALLSSVYTPSGHFTGSLQANINPLTSLITSRLLGVIPTSAPSGAQIKNAAITPEKVVEVQAAIAALFQPIYTALAIPASETADPTGRLRYKALVNFIRMR